MSKIKDLINKDPDILGGTPVFRGTRVPVRILFDCVAEGESLDAFLDQFPTVSREQALAVMEEAKDTLFIEYESAA
jgi:uncharacterized protein (DUF433 family)